MCVVAFGEGTDLVCIYCGGVTPFNTFTPGGCDVEHFKRFAEEHRTTLDDQLYTMVSDEVHVQWGAEAYSDEGLRPPRDDEVL